MAEDHRHSRNAELFITVPEHHRNVLTVAQKSCQVKPPLTKCLPLYICSKFLNIANFVFCCHKL